MLSKAVDIIKCTSLDIRRNSVIKAGVLYYILFEILKVSQNNKPHKCQKYPQTNKKLREKAMKTRTHGLTEKEMELGKLIMSEYQTTGDI